MREFHGVKLRLGFLCYECYDKGLNEYAGKEVSEGNFLLNDGEESPPCLVCQKSLETTAV